MTVIHSNNLLHPFIDVLQWRNGRNGNRMAEMVEWRNGGMAEWRERRYGGKMVEWREWLHTYYLRYTHTDDDDTDDAL